MPLHRSRMFMLGVEPGSPASRAGPREGDNLMESSGQAIAGFDDLQTIAQARKLACARRSR